jgi:hypothetical protein
MLPTFFAYSKTTKTATNKVCGYKTEGTPQSPTPYTTIKTYLREHLRTGIVSLNKAIIGPSTQQFFSSDVIATTCFGHTTIIKQHTVVYCLKLYS